MPVTTAACTGNCCIHNVLLQAYTGNVKAALCLGTLGFRFSQHMHLQHYYFPCVVSKSLIIAPWLVLDVRMM